MGESPSDTAITSKRKTAYRRDAENAEEKLRLLTSFLCNLRALCGEIFLWLASSG